MTGDLFISYYGDDFTGSTDVMEALTTGGVETVLFTSIPGEKQLEKFKHCRAVGLAGISRSQTPEWMSEHLPAIFSWLWTLDARFCHYKTCSTFDSSPQKAPSAVPGNRPGNVQSETDSSCGRGSPASALHLFRKFVRGLPG